MTKKFYDWPLERQTLALAELAETALQAYEGSFSQPELVKYRENAIFSVQRDDGLRLALRIHRHGYHSDAALASELMWMQALADEGIGVPGVIRTRDGSTLTFAAAARVPERRQIDLLEWLDGRSLGDLETQGELDAPQRRALYASIGALAARLHDHSAAWPRPAGFVRHSWHAEALVGSTPLWGRFWQLKGLSSAQVTLLGKARERAHRGLRDYGVTADNFGLIHADLLGDNVLVDARGRAQACFPRMG